MYHLIPEADVASQPLATRLPGETSLGTLRNPIVGLTMEIAKLVICYLNGTEPSEEVLAVVFGEPTGTITKIK